MLDIELFRENSANLIRADHDKRGISHEKIDQVIDLDNEWKNALHDMELARRERNTAARSIS